nr:uncharacterized protein LOC114268424 [Ipomoea batatas]GME20460.1 uncharacterized protein LOC114268424 [Ipomoea batatas]
MKLWCHGIPRRQRLVSASSGSEGILYSDDRRTALHSYSISGLDPAYSISGNALPALPIANVFFLTPTAAARLDRRRLLLPYADAGSPRRPLLRRTQQLLRRSYSLVDPSCARPPAAANSPVLRSPVTTSTVQAPTGNEDDDDLEFENFQWNGSDMGE